MTESFHEEVFVEPKGSLSLKLIAAIAALAVAVLLFAGYAYLRHRHAEDSGLSSATSQAPAAEAKPPKALIIVDEALLSGGKTTLGGAVKNTSNDKLSNVSVELELKRRKDGVAEKKLVVLEPAELEPNQEGRYSLQLQARDYSSARLVTLRAGPDSAPVAYATAHGQKRPPERLETKTITVGKPPSSKRDEFLNSPDNPARVP
jgi:hypothetical protein